MSWLFGERRGFWDQVAATNLQIGAWHLYYLAPLLLLAGGPRSNDREAGKALGFDLEQVGRISKRLGHHAAAEIKIGVG